MPNCGPTGSGSWTAGRGTSRMKGVNSRSPSADLSAAGSVRSASSMNRNAEVAIAPELLALVAELESNISGVVLGKAEIVRMCVVALLAGEHVLLEDVPGVGKTLLGKALAKSVNAQFCRIQFTPDLLPSDIVGSSVFNTKTHEFVYNPGPVFANIVLADEINRTT